MLQLMQNSCMLIFHTALGKSPPFILVHKALLSLPATAAALTLLFRSDRLTQSSSFKLLLTPNPPPF